MNQFRWAEYVDVADQLIQRSNPPLTEAMCRAAMSRAYYGAYHNAAKVAAARQIPLANRDSDHQTVWVELGKLVGQPENLIGTKGKQLKRYRHQADYKLNSIANPVKTAQAALILARDINSEIRRLNLPGVVI